MLIVNQIFEDSPLVRDERAKGEHIAVSPDDNGVIRRLREEADGFAPEEHGGRRLECWLLLESGEALWLLQKEGLIRAITEKADVVATTMDDLAAMSIATRSVLRGTNTFILAANQTSQFPGRAHYLRHNNGLEHKVGHYNREFTAYLKGLASFIDVTIDIACIEGLLVFQQTTYLAVNYINFASDINRIVTAHTQGIEFH